jgi:CRISPR-associated exonuclease Cas4
MLRVPAPAGAVYDGKARRRDVVIFDEPLRQEVERYAALMHGILLSGRTPLATYAKKCESCSMKPVCLPSVVEPASASRYLARAISANLKQSSSENAAHDDG